ncbi:MAG: penicillin-binding protein activator [Alphaproteobacteria bacterium]|nr:penicillin-binding protein activator [Alphaproteobacteria bacterium]
MKLSVFLAACLVLALSVGGCADRVTKPSASAKPKEDWPIPPAPQIKAPPIPAPQIAVKEEKVRVAILLPLSGPHASLGQAMLNAAQQALFDSAEYGFELQPRDTGQKGGAEEAARQAVTSGAKLIIGPMFATEVPSVKLMAQVNDLMVLPLSTDTSLADKGVFVMGLAPGPQVARVTTFAARHGLKNFAALIPATPYGALVEKVFKETVGQVGGKLVALEIFDQSGNLADKVKELAAHKDEIDALFLPESDLVLGSVAQKLAAAGFDTQRTRLLGTGLWDVPELGRQNSFLVGGWFAAPDPALRRRFISNYTELYNIEPPRLATLAYDATALAAFLAKRGGRYDEASLTNPNGFVGLDGIFRLISSGEVERGMAVAQVSAIGATVIDPAPQSFIKGGK